MPFTDTSQFVDALRQFHLLEHGQLDELAAELKVKPRSADDLAIDLVKRKWLTTFQVNQLVNDKGADLVLGSYVLIDKIGEGGMGAVFKARNWKLGRIVALKLIRKEKLDNPDSIKRFEREIRAVSKLNHPNIIAAYDADQVGDTHFFVMEFVDGIDLSQLVKERGPLPVDVACEYVRQAAMGLQHAFEHGIISRDIKPSNLLVSSSVDRVVGGERTGDPRVDDLEPVRSSHQGIRKGGVVKLLVLGLAGMQHGASEVGSGTLTETGSILATPDFMSPEQCRQSHDVDIRSDLYSLGATFYFLLTGRSPFEGGTFGEKLVKHQLEFPDPVEQVRPEVPSAVGAVIQTLMKKLPEERYQTPAELVAVLEKGLETDE